MPTPRASAFVGAEVDRFIRGERTKRATMTQVPWSLDGIHGTAQSEELVEAWADATLRYDEERR